MVNNVIVEDKLIFFKNYYGNPKCQKTLCSLVMVQGKQKFQHNI